VIHAIRNPQSAIRPRISLIVARARNGVIGRDGELPWSIPGELAHFRRTTMGHPIIMGRKTWESIVARSGKPLPGRRNIVVTRNPRYVAAGAEVVDSLEAAVALCAGVDDVFVIGGAELYALALPRAARAIVTEIDTGFDGDAHFPPLDPAQWRIVDRQPGSGEPAHAFVTYERMA
jgi:dihydrofolate reductase